MEKFGPSLSDTVIPKEQYPRLLSLANKAEGDPKLFQAANKTELEKLKQAVYSHVDKLMLKQDGFDPKRELTIVFVPLPCPSMGYYEQCEKSMITTCKAAKATGGRVIIVRSLYGRGQHSASWTNQVTQHLPTRFAEFIESKTVHLADTFAAGGTSTPWAYVFIDGKLTKTANIGEFSGAMTTIGKAYEAKNDAAKAKAWLEAAATLPKPRDSK